ncbi:MAG: transglycosylase SLT domain-containing protein [Trueperaceae bacterium]|nr:transglycosylase SLT domain-containing protein [Trueperaceae bacterium]MCC6310301.1 transglycosylase SLT domain-containing protein [Trueperaceae bacterium]MCO5173301.1 transglycosylase SLT domain-containing protein [Trueperaceae bacterium]MCW5818750.1 transglycosylase SLT domain-containing protein [Trueperaceae bacterium]
MSLRSIVLVGLALVALTLHGRAAAPDSSITIAPLEPYQELYAARAMGDAAALERLAFGGDRYSAYLAAVELSAWPQLSAGLRLRALERVLELRMPDSLLRAEKLRLDLMHGELAEAAGETAVAVAAYREVLPDPTALAAFLRLEQDPYARANGLLAAGRNEEALQALDGLAAPSIEAPALRALGRYEEALAAYDAWLAADPGNATAALGRAWCLYYLRRDDAATAAFAALGQAGDYGLGLLANRAGRTDAAVDYLRATGRADYIWLATDYLETQGRYADAIPIYLELARGGSAYADDAAYRAYVLAQRLGDAGAERAALDLIPLGSFFALKLGGLPAAPDPTSAPVGEYTRAAILGTASELAAPTLTLASYLVGSGDKPSAVGELLFGLRDAEAAGDVYAVLQLSEALQGLDEYRQSVRAARALLGAGIDDLRVWRLAYPPAWPATVRAAALDNDLEPALIWAVMRQESAFSPVAVSRSNAQGLMQVVPTTWDWLAELRKEQPGDPFDVVSSIEYGATYLRWLLNYFSGDEELVIASYNGGQGYVRRTLEGDVIKGDRDDFYRLMDRSETREYLQIVSENLAVYRVLYPGLGADGADWASLLADRGE